MIVTGLITLIFVVLHLETFKYGPLYTAAAGDRDLYRLMIEVFHRPGYVALYVVCLTLLGMHLRHGISSTVQSLGLMPDSGVAYVLRAGAALAVLTAIGFIIIPIWIYFFR